VGDGHHVARLLQTDEMTPYALLDSRALAWALISVGAALRLVQYAANRPLWLDEALISLNIVNKSFGDLFGVLNFNQGAPPGFLVVEKLAVELLGRNEYALRLFPLLCGLASLPLFHRLAESVLKSRWAALVALASFALLDPLIYYSSEVKQYACDVLAALVLWIVADRLVAGRRGRRQVIALAVAGAVAICFSHASLLVLAAVGTVLGIQLATARQWWTLSRVAVVGAVWTSALAAAYLVSFRHLERLQRGAAGVDSENAMPFPPSSRADVDWFTEQGDVIFRDMIGWGPRTALVAGALCLVGAVAHLARDRAQAALLLLPLPYTLAASALHQYPFGHRFVLFLFPLVPLYLAGGAVWLARRLRHPAAVAVPAAALVLLLGLQLRGAARDVVDPVRRENITPVLRYLERNWRSGDRLYVHYGAQYAFRFYEERRDGPSPWPIVAAPDDASWFAPALVSQPPRLVVGVFARDERAKYRRDLRRVQGGRRIWVLISHAVGDEKAVLLRHLHRRGHRLGGFRTHGASVHLFDLSRPTSSST
jgi:hypothetical protein